MINSNDSIRFTNVLSRKYRIHYTEFDEVLKAFINDIGQLKATIKKSIFYSINNVPLDEMVETEIFIPVEEHVMDCEDMDFHSYYSIEGMISMTVIGNFERNTEIVYALLFNYMNENSLQQVTPIFHVMSGDESFPYVFVKIGVAEEE